MSNVSFNPLSERDREKSYQFMKKKLEDNETNRKLLKEFKENTISYSNVIILYKKLFNIL